MAGVGLPVMQWVADNNVANLASVLGVIISLIGFAATLWNVWRSRSAAERAQYAAEQVRLAIRTHDALADFAEAVAILEEIRRLHRTGASHIVADRYAALRKVLTNVKGLAPNLTDTHKAIIQGALTTLSSMEAHVEKSIARNQAPDFAKMNRLLSRDLDEIHAMLVNFKSNAQDMQP